jgi:hypothetical protein
MRGVLACAVTRPKPDEVMFLLGAAKVTKYTVSEVR